MKTLLLATTLFGNVFSVTTEPPFGQSKFVQVMDNFRNGTLPAFSEVIGWWSGNCYRPGDSDEGEGTLLVAVEREWEEKSWWPWADPIIRIERNMAFIVTLGRSDPPHHYDNMPEDERYQVTEFLSTWTFKSLQVSISDGSVKSGIKRHTLFSIRKFEDSLVGASWDSYEDHGPYNVCAFHKKVT